MIWAEVLTLAVLLSALLLGPQVDDLRAEEWHHGYLGVLLFAFGWSFGWAWLEVMGLVLTTDDALQHAAQRWLNRPAFRSPFYRLYGLTLYRLAWVRRLNKWLDRGMG